MKKIMPFILIVLVIGLILGFSSQSGDTSNGISSGISRRLAAFLIEHKSYGYEADEINFIIRKLAHFTEYLVFSVLLVIGLHNLIERVIPSLIITGLFGVGLAFIDEQVQLRSIERTSSLFDVMIDSSGVMIGLVAVTLFIILSTIERKQRV